MKKFTNWVNLFRELAVAFRKPPMTLKMVPEVYACGPENSSKSRIWHVNLIRYKVGTRVRRSYSLKAKTSENVGIFVLALKRKKMFFFALFAIKRNTPNSEKNESENESEAKREEKSYNSSKRLKVSF